MQKVLQSGENIRSVCEESESRNVVKLWPAGDQWWRSLAHIFNFMHTTSAVLALCLNWDNVQMNDIQDAMMVKIRLSS